MTDIGFTPTPIDINPDQFNNSTQIGFPDSPNSFSVLNYSQPIPLGLTIYPGATEVIENLYADEARKNSDYSPQMYELLLPNNSQLVGHKSSVTLTALPNISVSAIDSTATEKLVGQTSDPGKFRLTRTGDLTQAFTVQYSVSGTAGNGIDYTQLTGFATFAAGASVTDIVINPIDDLTKEGTESVILTLAADATKYTLGNAKATVNIVDNDIATITIQASDATAAETATGVTPNPGRFTIKRIGGNISQSLTAYYTIGGNATSGTDYTAITNSVTFAAGSDTATINITPIDDNIFEGSEKVTLSLATNANYLLGTSQVASVTIADNDLPTITIAPTDANAAETVAGQPTNPGRFTLTRTGSKASSLTVNYTIGGTATKGTDYNSLTGTVTFAAGSATAIIDINAINDTLVEGNETVVLTLTANSKYNIGTNNTATVTIADNDVLPTITITATDGTAGETVTGQTANPGRFTLTRTGSTASSLTVNYTIGGTATKGTDYNSLTGTVTFAAGSATAIIDINAIDDTLVEGNETVVLTLAANGNYAIGANNTATVTIADNDTFPGSLQLVKQFGTSQEDLGVGIATDRDGNNYIAGHSWVTVNGIQSYDSWLTKRDAAGREVWTRIIRTADIPVTTVGGSTYFGYYNDLATNVVVDRVGNVYIVGTSQLSGSITHLNDPNNPNDDTSDYVYNSDTWLAKYDALGNQVWFDRYDYSLEDIAWDLAIDKDNNLYVGGYTSESTTTTGGAGAFLMKYTSNGTRSWIQRLGNRAYDQIREVTTDSAGNIYVVGKTFMANGFSGDDVWAAKYDGSGNRLWLQVLAATNLNEEATGIGVDGNGNVYISGNSSVGKTQENTWLIKLDTNGNSLWRFDRNNTNQLAYAYQDLAVDASGKVYLSGLKGTAITSTTTLVQALLEKVDSNGKKLWEQQLGPTNGSTTASNISLGGDGRIYLTGWTSGTLSGTNAGGKDAWYAVFSNDTLTTLTGGRLLKTASDHTQTKNMLAINAEIIANESIPRDHFSVLPNHSSLIDSLTGYTVDGGLGHRINQGDQSYQGDRTILWQNAPHTLIDISPDHEIKPISKNRKQPSSLLRRLQAIFGK